MCCCSKRYDPCKYSIRYFDFYIIKYFQYQEKKSNTSFNQINRHFYPLDFRLLINILFLIIWNQLFVLITVPFCDSRSLFLVVHVLREHYENERVFQFVQHELLKDSSIIQSMFRYHTHTHTCEEFIVPYLLQRKDALSSKGENSYAMLKTKELCA